MIVVNDKFEIIYSYIKRGGDPFGRPIAKSLFPIFAKHAKENPDGSLPPIPKEALNTVTFQGIGSVPGALCSIS